MLAPIHAFDAERSAQVEMARARWRSIMLRSCAHASPDAAHRLARRATAAQCALDQAVATYQAARFRAAWWERALVARGATRASGR